MQKFLRTLMLAALMLVPFASRAQVTTFPYSCDFEDATEAAAWTFVNGTLTNQWVLGTAVNNTPSGSYGIYISNDAGTSAAYNGSSAATVYAYREFYLTPGEYTVTFDWKCNGESNYDYLLAALVDASVTLTAGTSLPTGVSYTAITATGWSNLGPTSPNFKMNLSTTWNTQSTTFTVTTAGTYRIVFLWRDDTSTGNNPGACVDNVVVTQNSCPTPSGLLANNITSSSMDLTWTENGAATSWLVYVNGEYDGTANSTSYSLTGLNGNTVYTIAVRSFCGAGDTSNAVTGTFRTACPESVVLPYVEEFNGYSGFQSYAYTGPSIPPACWGYFSNGTNTAATTTSAYYGGVYQYSSNSSYGSMEANNPYLCMIAYVVGSSASSTYTGYRNARGDVKYAIMPALATPINGLQIGFDYKMSSAYSATGAATVLELGYTTGDDTSTFVSMWSQNAVSTTQHVVDLNLSTLAAAAPAGVRLAFKFHGTHNGTSTSSGTAVYCGIDNIVVENLPSCARVTNLTVSGITNNSVTLNWVDTINTGATYTVSDADGIIATGINAMTYTVTGLTANSDYTFSVVTNCSATDNSTATTVSVHTDCDAMTTLPYTQDFEAEATGSGTSAAFAECWNRLNNGTQYFGYPYISSSSTYNHTDGGSKGLYWYYPTTTGTYGDYSCIVLPELGGTYSVSDCRLKFWAKASSTSYHPVFIVGVLTDAHDITTFVPVDTVNVEGTTFAEYTVNLNGYTGAGTFVAIRANRPTSAWYAYVDDILLEELPSCVEVSGLTASNITSTSITLTWTDAANTGATYSVTNSNGTVVASGITATTYTVTGLTANTEYTFAVEANCSATDASPAVTVSARTACEANTVFPWSDDFESYTASSSGVTLDAPCWVNEHITGGGTSLFQVYTGTQGTNTTNKLRLPDMTSGTQTKLALPPMEFPTGSTYQFVIDVYRNTTSYASEGVRVYASTDGEITGATELGFLYRNYTQTDNGVVTAETASGWYTYEFTIPFTGTCYIILRGESSYGSATYMDNFIIREAPSCLAVTGLTASNITDNSITLTWTDGVNTGATYSVYDMSDTSLVESYITGTTYTVTNLTANTQYTFGVVANCSATDNSLFTTVNGRTACAVETMPWSENFDTWESKSPCWSFLSGAYNMGAGTPTTSSSAWTLNTSYGDYITISGKALTMNIYSTNRYWAVTPSIEMTGDAMFSVDVAVAAWSAATPNYDADDTLAIAISNNNGTTWTNLRVLNNTELNALSGTYTTINVPVNGYTGDTVRFAVFGGSSASGGDNRIAIDNFSVAEPPACMPITGLTAINIATDSARLTWVGNATSYTILDMADSSIVSTTTDTTYLLENLTAMTQYTYGVVANCGSNNSDTIVVTFTTACSAINLPYSESFSTTSATSGCWQLVSNNTANEANMGFMTVDGRSVLQFSSYTSATDYNQYGFSPIMNVSTDAINLGVKVTYATRSSDYLYFGYVTANDTVWDPTAYNTNSSYSSYNWQTLEFVIPATATQLAVRYYGDYAYYAWVDSVSVVEMSASFCYPVTAVTVDSVTATSVSISWTDTSATGNYSVYNGTTYVGTTANTNYTFTGLTASTGYTFGVVALCSATDSSSMETINATTDCLGGSCQITINGTDSYGDGWADDYGTAFSTITISQNGATVGTFTLTTGTSYSETFQVCSGAPVTFSWTSNSDYDDEAAFQILDGGNTVVYTCADASALTDGAVFTTVADPCPSCAVTALTVDTADLTSVTISWTGSAASYDVYNGTTFVANVTTNSYTFTGLTAATAYTFGVQAICSATDSSALATINAMTACADITTLPYLEGFENGLGCWNTVNGSADGYPWFATTSNSNITAHSGNAMAASVSYYSGAVHANAWLISPKFVLPTIAAGDTLNLAWWHKVSASWPTELYDVMLSTTTDDTAAFTTTLLAVTPDSTNDWVNKVVDLSAYAGQSVYIAFHHHDSYNQNYLLIDDITLSVGAAPVPDPDTLTVTFAVDDATMGTTTPAPGTYQYITGDTVRFAATANAGYHFDHWVLSFGTQSQSISYQSAYAPASILMSYGDSITLTAYFVAGNPDSTTITYAVNDATLGTITPAPGTYTIYVGDAITASATAYTGAVLSAWVLDIMMNGAVYDSDTITSDDPDFANPMNFGNLPQSFADYNASIVITAIFEDENPGTTYYTVTGVAADTTMGYVLGSNRYVAGSEATLTAVANNGYRFVRWSNGETTATISFTVTENVELTAYFEVSTEGIEDVAAEATVFSTDNKIVVRGAEGQSIYVFDVNGRVMAREANAAESVEFRMETTGVYLVKVGTAAAKRVVVMR